MYWLGQREATICDFCFSPVFRFDLIISYSLYAYSLQIRYVLIAFDTR